QIAVVDVPVLVGPGRHALADFGQAHAQPFAYFFRAALDCGELSLHTQGKMVQRPGRCYAHSAAAPCFGLSFHRLHRRRTCKLEHPVSQHMAGRHACPAVPLHPLRVYPGSPTMSESIKLRSQHQAHCKDCSLTALCLPLSLNMEDMDALDEIVKR